MTFKTHGWPYKVYGYSSALDLFGFIPSKSSSSLLNDRDKLFKLLQLFGNPYLAFKALLASEASLASPMTKYTKNDL